MDHFRLRLEQSFERGIKSRGLSLDDEIVLYTKDLFFTVFHRGRVRQYDIDKGIQSIGDDSWSGSLIDRAETAFAFLTIGYSLSEGYPNVAVSSDEWTFSGAHLVEKLYERAVEVATDEQRQVFWSQVGVDKVPSKKIVMNKNVRFQREIYVRTHKNIENKIKKPPYASLAESSLPFLLACRDATNRVLRKFDTV